MMVDTDKQSSRRRVLRLTGTASALLLSGCSGVSPAASGGPASVLDQDPDDATHCLDDLATEEVSESERTAESIDGIQRDPDADFTLKENAAYTCRKQGMQMCANCRFFVPSRDGDRVGACTVVAGEVRSTDWCGLYRPSSRFREGNGPSGDAGDQYPADGTQTSSPLDSNE